MKTVIFTTGTHRRFYSFSASWIRSLVFLLLVLVCLLTNLNTAGVTAGGAMLNVFSRIVWLILAGGLCLSLDLCRLYRGLSCGRSFLLFRLLMPFVWEVDNIGVVRHVGRLLVDLLFSPF